MAEEQSTQQLSLFGVAVVERNADFETLDE
jgi:hypothetical protein